MVRGSGGQLGAVYVYTLPDIANPKELTAPDGIEADQFGASVAIDDTTIVVGAPHGSGTVAESGAAYRFTIFSSDIDLASKLIAKRATSGAQFGASIATDGGKTVIGASLEGRSSGAVYLFGNNHPARFNEGIAMVRRIPENTPYSIPPFVVSAVDPDGDPIGFLTVGDDSTEFTSGQTGDDFMVTFKPVTLPNDPTTLDYELKDAYRAAVLTLDGLDLFGNRDPRDVDDVITITILVTNIDENGSVALSTTTPGALKPITATLTDPDTLIYEGMPSYNRWVWQSSADGAIWTNVSEATTQTASVEMVPSADLVGQMLRIGVQYDDGHGRGKSAMSITTAPVNAPPPPPVNNAPVFLRGEYANLSVPENTAEGESIDPAFVHHATDSDEGDTLTYTLGGADAGLFDIDRGTGEITVGAGTMLDY